MNKKLVPAIAILLLLAGAAYAMNSKRSPAPSSQTVGQATNEANEFTKAIESGKPTLCTLTKGQDTMEYFIKGKKMRINTTTNVPDDKGVVKTTIGHMINDETFFYAWDDTQKQGTKMSLLIPSPSPAASIAPIETAPKFDSGDYNNFKNEGYTINCKAGSVSDSDFTPPSDVKFIDPTELMKAIPSPDANGGIDMSKLKELQQQYGGTNPEDQ